MSKRWLGLLFLVVVWIGGGGVARAAPGTISVSPSNFDFGNVRVANAAVTTATKTFTISNTAAAATTLTISDSSKITFTDSDYSLQPAPSFPITIAGGASKTITVQFNPSTSGTHDATMAIVSDDPATPTTNISLTGVGTTAVIAVSDVNFGTVDDGTTSNLSIAVTNSATSSRGVLTVTSATISGGSFFSFGTTQGCNGGTSCTFTQPFTVTSGTLNAPVRCQPPAAASGTQTATVTFVSDTDPGGDASAQLTCTAGAPQISVVPATLALAFANTEVGRTSATLTVTATNTGNGSLTISSATFNTGGGDYTVAGTTGSQTLIPNGTASWDIACRPSAQGARPGKFRIVSNSLTGSPTDITLTCTGEQGVVATNPTSLDFGPVVVGTPPKTLPFTLQNTGNVPITGITGTLNNTAIGYQFDPATVPTTLAAGASVPLAVTFTPQSGTDGGPATIRFTAGWGNFSSTTTATLTLNGDGQDAGYTITPMATFDFGNFRFDTKPQITYHIVNTGQASVTIQTQAFTPNAGTTASEIAIEIRKAGAVVTLRQTLAMGEQLDVTVTAQPNNRIGLLSGHIDIHSDLPMMPDRQVTLTGNSSTAAISVPALVDFGPVDVDGPAQTKTFTLTNNGAATLDIASITKMAGASPAFTVTLPAGATQVAPGNSLSLTITYKPTVERPPNQFDTAVLVANNLGGIFGGPTQAMITLQGRGIDRHLAIDPVQEFPVTVLGPANAEPIQAITVHNNGEATLSITALMFGGNPVWELVDPSPADIPGNSSHDFLVRFVPTTIGSFSGDLALVNNDNDQPMAMVTLSGSAVFVDAHGSGGCNAAGAGQGGGAGLVLAALVFGALGRRRSSSRRRAGSAAGAATALCVIGAVTALAPAAHADSIGITVFEPTTATAGTSFQLQSPDVGEDGSWAANTILSYASNPLVLDLNMGGSSAVIRDTAIKRSTLLQLGAAYAFLGRFEAGATLPLYMQSGDPSSPMTSFLGKPVSGTATGDLALHAKARLWRGSGGLGSVIAGTSLTVVIPTATKDQFAGSDKPAAKLLLLGAFRPAVLASRLTISANAGAILRGKSVYANIEQQSGVAWGAGASYRVLDKLWATAEVFGEATPSGQQQGPGAMAPAITLSPIEWLAGVNYQLDPRFTIGLAAGRGVTNGLGTPDLRGVFSLSVVSGGAGLVAIHPSEAGNPDNDDDGDGIPNSADKCPNEPEDKDGFEDSDGCPDPDNDHDGIPDVKDKCPLDAEDKDGFQDADGCPDPDNDHDGIPDAKDKCPNDPEDKDGFEDLDGCPDPDNDHDGIPDKQDKCPNQPETINGYQDDDGCPDKGDTAIILSPDRIETLDPIQFTGLKLTKTSTPLVEQIGATLRAHAEIVRLRVTVHVQPTGDPDADQAKSDKRAQAVRDWLVQFGIAPARLEARGFGGQKPLVPPTQRSAAKINDRIEFIILERK